MNSKYKTKTKVRVCRRCGEEIYDYDSTTGEWDCPNCGDWADL